MRAAGLLALVAACYRPSPPPGVPCDPSAPHCPSGQSCIAGACSAGGIVDAPLDDRPDSSIVDALIDARMIDARMIDAAMIDAPMVDAKMIDAVMVDARPDALPIDAMTDAMTDGAVMVDAGAVHLDYIATVAHCLDPALPDLTTCTDDKGASQLAIDGMVDATGTRVFQGFIRFDLDGQLAGHVPTAVSLIVTDSGAVDSDSDSSGEVWTVTAFTSASLATAAPTKIGTAPIAPAQGPIALAQVVTFVLPTQLAGANQSIYLGLYSDSTDGVQYWDTTGPVPPRLHIDAQ